MQEAVGVLPGTLGGHWEDLLIQQLHTLNDPPTPQRNSEIKEVVQKNSYTPENVLSEHFVQIG